MNQQVADFTGPPRLGPSGAAAAWEERDFVGELEIQSGSGRKPRSCDTEQLPGHGAVEGVS